MKKWIQSFIRRRCKHDWAFAEGIAPGVITGEPRSICFRRCCVRCGKREEIVNYRYVHTCDGVHYMAGPVWGPDSSQHSTLNSQLR